MEVEQYSFLAPDQSDWLERPKNRQIDAGTIGFFLGVLILIAMIWFALITPALCEGIMRSIISGGSALVPDGSTEFQIAGVTYNTKDIVADLFSRAF